MRSARHGNSASNALLCRKEPRIGLGGTTQERRGRHSHGDRYALPASLEHVESQHVFVAGLCEAGSALSTYRASHLVVNRLPLTLRETPWRRGIPGLRAAGYNTQRSPISALAVRRWSVARNVPTQSMGTRKTRVSARSKLVGNA